MTSSASSLRLAAKLVALGVVCYGGYYLGAPADTSVVDVTAPMIDELVEHQEGLFGRSLTASEREVSVDDYVDQELLVREALRQGLDRGDRRIRAMLLEHARRELLRQAGYEPPKPTENELKTYFKEHADRYRAPERIDLHQVLFLDGTVPLELDDVLSELRAGADFTTMGAASPGSSAKGVSRSQVAQAYGLRFASAVFSLEDGEWHGPLTSSAGEHFVRILARSPGRELGYEDVKDTLEQAYMWGVERRILDGEIAQIRRRYRIEIEDVE